ncbi:MAG: sensor histidine kinase [Bacteroidota bacterium]
MDTLPEVTLNVLLGGIITMLLLAFSLVIFFVLYQRRLFEQQNKIIDQERSHQRELLSAAVEIQESERRRIASDLHDDIGSLLSAARLYLKQLPVEEAEGEEIKSETLNIVSRTIRNTRRITHDLLPSELEKFGLSAAVEDLCQRLDRTDQLSVKFHSDLIHRLTDPCEIALFRVVQELANNTLKHAEATEIKVELTTQGDDFILRYTDNGKGFDQEITTVRGGSGLGLRNIESRISLIDGTLYYETSSGAGLKVVITLPLTKAQPEQPLLPT